jgi:CO dehydrogenase maturation factor
MKIAVVGKGGAGKTTTAAIVARTLGRAGMQVTALDCDTNANLGLSLGVGWDATAGMSDLRTDLEEGAAEHAPTWAELIARFGTDAPDGVRLAVVNRIEEPDPG